MNHQPSYSITVSLPDWVHPAVDWHRRFQDDQEKMAVAIELARENIARSTGGPFGAAIFDMTTGQLFSVGVNCVTANNNSVLHAEVMAIMLAEQRLGSFTLTAQEKRYELFCSCEPCAMCLGATLWSGVTRLVCAATGDDARNIGFDEGPVFAESFTYLHNKGIDVKRGFNQAQGQAVLQDYARRNGLIYNP